MTEHDIAIIIGVIKIVLLSSLVVVFWIGFMTLVRIYSFYEIKRLCRKKKKAGKFKSKILRTFYKSKSWPKLKLGLPGMADRIHPKTRVRFDSKGFPKFKAYYTVKLRKEFWRESRERHFYIANKILYEKSKTSTKLNKLFSKKQKKELANYNTPSGYTWHHHQDKGVLQLVDEEIHAKTSHIGGYSLWGGK